MSIPGGFRLYLRHPLSRSAARGWRRSWVAQAFRTFCGDFSGDRAEIDPLRSVAGELCRTRGAGCGWSDEKRTVLANVEVDDSAFSVARRFCDGGRRDRLPLAPPCEGGKLGATSAERSLRSFYRKCSTGPRLQGGDREARGFRWTSRSIRQWVGEMGTHFRGAKGDYGRGWLVIPGISATFRNSTTP